MYATSPGLPLGGMPQLAPQIPMETILSILTRAKAIADDEGLELGASFGSQNGPWASPLQITFSVPSH